MAATDGIGFYQVDATLPNDLPKQSIDCIHFARNQSDLYSINGSLHKYSNEGDNSNDFKYTDLFETTYSFCKRFKIEPESTRISKIEVGVNLKMDNVDEIRRSVILYKSIVGNFEHFGSGKGRRFVFSDYDFKIYKKKENVLRVEVKVKRGRFLKRNKVYLNTLDELLYEDVQIALSGLLIKTFEGLTIVHLSDEEIKRLDNADTIKYLKYCNPNYWEELEDMNKQKFRRERQKCKDFIQKHSDVDMKAVLLDKIKNKSKELLNFSELNIEEIMDKYERNEKPKVNGMYYLVNSIQSNQFNYYNKWVLSVQNTANNNVIKIPLLYNLNEMIENSTKTPIAI